MNVLEKILEEIEEASIKVSTVKEHTYFKAIGTRKAKEIIRSHMDEAKDINVPSNDGWIDRKELKEEIKSLRFAITGMRNGKTMTKLALEEYRKIILKIIDEQPTYMDDGWISVDERLPEEGEKCIITDKYGYVRDGIIYDYADSKDDKPSFHRWDDEYWQCFRPDVIAWQPLPKLYRQKEIRI